MLVNRNSASASEIVSGALQDHDRALVVGETTFGKALVQSVYKISEQAGLALTTGRYYTPSGRLIQRPWDGAFDEYLTYTLRDQKGERQHNPSDLKHTEAGRKVYSGGGIEPDKFMAGPVEGSRRRSSGARSGAAGSSSASPTSTGRGRHTRFSAANQAKKRIAKGFVVSDEMLKDFREQLATQKVTSTRRRSRPICLHQGDDPLRDRSGAVRRRRGAATSFFRIRRPASRSASSAKRSA